jgi:hypothetical protein
MTKLSRFITLLCALTPFWAEAQSSLENFAVLPLKDLSSFDNPPGNWSVKGAVTAHPFKAGAVSTSSGEGVLVGNSGAPLKFKEKFNDLKLKLEFMVSPSSEGAIVLPGGYRLLLSDSWQQAGVTAKTSGYLDQFPIQNVSRAPGLWQTLELSFDASTKMGAKSPRLNYLAINGVVVQQGVFLAGVKSGDVDRLALEVTKGGLAFRSIAYQQLGDQKPVAISNLSYKLFTDPWDSKVLSKKEQEKQAMELTQEVGGGRSDFHLIYEGDLTVAESAQYYFTAVYTGPAFTFEVDGKIVISAEESYSASHVGAITLDKGTHKFKLRYSRYPWSTPALGLQVEKWGVRPYDLHARTSLPESTGSNPYLSVEPKKEVELVRSFIQLEGEKNKRTHCLSVGNPEGRHYTVDLNRGALLQVWRGGFANVTEMWLSRGEPQLLKPEGVTVAVSGKSSVAPLSDKNAAWPDSSNISFSGYRIGEKGEPLVRYKFADTEVVDQLIASPERLERRLRLEKPTSTPYYALLAVGRKIVKIEKGLYLVDNDYFLQVDKKASVLERTQGGVQELLLPLSATTSYSLFW